MSQDPQQQFPTSPKSLSADIDPWAPDTENMLNNEAHLEGNPEPTRIASEETQYSSRPWAERIIEREEAGNSKNNGIVLEFGIE